MAAPPEVNLNQLDGKFMLNKKLSDSFDALLALQGVSWAVRKAASYATPRLTIKSATRLEDSMICLEIHAVVIGSGSTDNVSLDWSTVDKTDSLLGDYKAKMGWSTAAELSEDVLRDGVLNAGGTLDAKYIRIVIESSRDGMVGEHVWSFESVDGVRRYVRRLAVRKGEKVVMAKSVYDYTGKV
ncbi:hypothetical protein HYALB_00008031 [Hymenoscyphus albidus]|uniref:Uncharacterized protein n=1 Tax=Hymenoscyphus albidus TaxID=595503 RepID=A0A9N9Q6I0_9HELO|nr:hypothetical protein HYALB_00008031 [Hymenoscyphus albidus]